MLAEVKGMMRELGYAWESFKTENEQRLRQLETRGVADPLTVENIARLNKTMDGCMKRIEQIEAAGQRPGLHGDRVDASSEQFAEYLRKGVLPTYKGPYAAHNDEYGAVLVSPQVSKMVIKNNYENSPFRQLATIEQVSTSTLEMIVDVDNFSNLGSGWSLERITPGTVGMTDAAKVTAYKVDTYELYAQPTTTQKFLEDSAINVEQWLTDKISYAFSQEENKVFLDGSGSDRPKGVFSYPFAVSSSETWGTINEVLSGVEGGLSVDPVIELYYSLGENFMSNASFLMHRRTMEQVRLLKQGDQYIWQPSYAPGTRETLLGIPVYFSEHMPVPASSARAIMIADFKKAFIIADRYAINVMRDPYSYKPLVAFYATKRVGFAVMNTNAVKVLRLDVA